MLPNPSSLTSPLSFVASTAGFSVSGYVDSADLGNYVHDMKTAGIAIMESMDGAVHDNVVKNVDHCIRISSGATGNSIYANTFDNCMLGKSRAGLR